MRNYFASDTHFSHGNIIKYCNRPFKDLTEMDLVLIRKWNERVKPEDTVYFLGDFCFKKSTEAPEARGADVFRYYRQQLNGNIIFIEGNHDSNNAVKTIMQSAVVKLGGKFIKLTHRPEHAEGKYDFNFCGHVHTDWKFKQQVMDGHITTLVNLSVDMWDFRPVTFEEIMSSYYKWHKQYRKEGGVK